MESPLWCCSWWTNSGDKRRSDHDSWQCQSQRQPGCGGISTSRSNWRGRAGLLPVSLLASNSTDECHEVIYGKVRKPPSILASQMVALKRRMMDEDTAAKTDSKRGLSTCGDVWPCLAPWKCFAFWRCWFFRQYKTSLLKANMATCYGKDLEGIQGNREIAQVQQHTEHVCFHIIVVLTHQIYFWNCDPHKCSTLDD